MLLPIALTVWIALAVVSAVLCIAARRGDVDHATRLRPGHGVEPASRTTTPSPDRLSPPARRPAARAHAGGEHSHAGEFARSAAA